MKADLDRLMEERNIDAFIILGTENDDMDRNYITNGAHASATVVKIRGSDPVLITHPMEADEAAKSGWQVYTMADFDYADVFQKYKDDREAFRREYFRNILTKLDVRGNVAFYGTAGVMNTWKRLNRIQEDYSDRLQIVEDEDTSIFEMARRTKDADEIEALRAAGRKTSLVLRQTRDWLSTLRDNSGGIVDSNGNPVTIGDVKRFVRLRLMEQEMEDVEGMIFAQGRDAGVPHSRGERDQQLQVGQTIIFDLFPRPIGGGYFHDSTRTWCLGHAPAEVEEAYQLVMRAFTQSLESLTVGQPTSELQDLVCEIFEAQGHATPRTNPGGDEGYIHSLGHGVGLNVHEAPGISNLSKDTFAVGDVVSIEPGLYYHTKGWGIRIEDTVYIDEAGTVHSLTDCPYELVIPLQG